MYRRALLSVALLLCAASLPTLALATPTGLNNIPTADVVDHGALVLQSFSQFGDGRVPSWFAGFKYGPAPRWEIGLDDTFSGPSAQTGPAAQVKYRTDFGRGARLGLGVANITGDTDRHGELFPYAVISARLAHRVTGHLGYSIQHDNEAWFAGADAPVSAHCTARADWIQTADGEESVASLGFIRALSPRWLVEAWGSFPTADSADNDYILKLDFVLPPRSP